MLWTVLIFNKSKRYQKLDIKDNGQRYQLVRCYNVTKTSLSFRYQLNRLCNVLVGQSHLGTSWYITTTYQISRVFYVPLGRRKNVSDRSVLLTYQLIRRDDLAAWSWTFKLVKKCGTLFWVPGSAFFGISGGSASLRYQLQRCYNVSKTLLFSVLVVTSLRRVKLVILTKILIGMSLRRLKLVGFILVPMRRRKDVTNRSASSTYQLRRHDDVSAWSTTSRAIWDLNETLLRRRIAGGYFVIFDAYINYVNLKWGQTLDAVIRIVILWKKA